MKYSDFSYTCIFDDSFNIVWTDNNDLFRRLARRHEMLKKRLLSARRSDTVYYEFTADKFNYMIKANILPDQRIICRASRELPKSVLSNEEILKDVENISFGSLNAISIAQMIQTCYKENAEFSIDEAISVQINQMTNIYADCLNITKLFETGREATFVPLEKFLLRTFDRIAFSLRGIRKSVSHCIMLEKPYWVVDYWSLENVLFNIVKFILILTSYGNGGLITVSSESETLLRISTVFSYHQNYPLTNCRSEMRVIQHLFKLMNGKVDFFQEKDYIVLEGYVNSESTYDINKVKWQLRYIFDCDIKKWRESWDMSNNVYYEFYRKPERPHMFFYSPVEEFTDIGDTDLMIWRMIFESAADRASIEEGIDE